MKKIIALLTVLTLLLALAACTGKEQPKDETAQNPEPQPGTEETGKPLEEVEPQPPKEPEEQAAEESPEELESALTEQEVQEPQEPSEPKIDFETDIDLPVSARLTVDEEASTMCIYAESTLSRVRIVQITTEDGLTWEETGCILELATLEANTSLALQSYLSCAIPNLALSFTRSDGTDAYYAIIMSGKDGSLLLQALEDVQAMPESA